MDAMVTWETGGSRS